VTESFAIRVYKQYFNFASSHFLIFADGTREPLHGHNYQVQVRVEGALADGDIVLDFIPLKPLVRHLCDDLDHVLLLPESNPHLDVSRRGGQVEVRHQDGSFFSIPESDVRVLPISNTSTEMLARFLARRIAADLAVARGGGRLGAIEVQVEESPGQCGLCRLSLESA
jgi:6-pyruvoyltetrahydropterin/6-carboxytetrahydropterin synthase